MSNSPSQPPWLIQGATVLVGVLLAFNVIFDALNQAYQGYEVTFGLLTVFGALLGVARALRGGDK